MALFGKTLNLISIGLGILWTGFAACLVYLGHCVSRDLGDRAHRMWGRGCCRLAGVKVRCEGLENFPKNGGAILAPNHESLFDILTIASLPINFKWISKAEIGRYPIIGRAMRKMGTHFVSRDRSGKDLNVMKGVEDGLRAGDKVVIFPEGTRTRTGELLPLKKGAFKTAQNAGVPLIPVAITGTFGIAPPGEFPSKRGHRVTIRLGKPFAVGPDDELSAVIPKFREELVQLLAKDRI
jgi:1-acyl-sn-glycerol-3-phosphate acyltransferase